MKLRVFKPEDYKYFILLFKDDNSSVLESALGFNSRGAVGEVGNSTLAQKVNLPYALSYGSASIHIDYNTLFTNSRFRRMNNYSEFIVIGSNDRLFLDCGIITSIQTDEQLNNFLINNGVIISD